MSVADVGLDLSEEYPKPLTDEVVEAADVVITMGCGDAGPIYPGKRCEDLDIPDPAGASMEQVRAILDQIKRRVEDLISSLGLNERSSTRPGLRYILGRVRGSKARI